jgi:hypothetical protein
MFCSDFEGRVDKIMVVFSWLCVANEFLCLVLASPALLLVELMQSPFLLRSCFPDIFVEEFFESSS